MFAVLLQGADDKVDHSMLCQEHSIRIWDKDIAQAALRDTHTHPLSLSTREDDRQETAYTPLPQDRFQMVVQTCSNTRSDSLNLSTASTTKAIP